MIKLAHIAGTALVNNDYRVELGYLPQGPIKVGENYTFSTSLENLDGARIFDITKFSRIS